MSVYIYIYIYTHAHLSLSVSLSISLSLYIYMYIHIYLYIYIYNYTKLASKAGLQELVEEAVLVLPTDLRGQFVGIFRGPLLRGPLIVSLDVLV